MIGQPVGKHGFAGSRRPMKEESEGCAVAEKVIKAGCARTRFTLFEIVVHVGDDFGFLLLGHDHLFEANLGPLPPDEPEIGGIETVVVQEISFKAAAELDSFIQNVGFIIDQVVHREDFMTHEGGIDAKPASLLELFPIVATEDSEQRTDPHPVFCVLLLLEAALPIHLEEPPAGLQHKQQQNRGSIEGFQTIVQAQAAEEELDPRTQRNLLASPILLHLEREALFEPLRVNFLTR